MSIIGNPILTGGMSPVLIEKEIDSAGVYIAASDNANGYSRVRVTGTEGGGGSGYAAVMTKAEWDALSVSEKQAYAYVGIISRDTGVNRGVLYYGEDYRDTWLVKMPGNVVGEANLTNIIDDITNVWGNNVHVEGASKNLDDTVATNATLSSTTIPIYITLPNTDQSFTAYIVSKYVSGSNRMIMSFGNENSTTSGGMGLLWANTKRTAVLSLWANDSTISASDPWNYENFVAAALAYDATTQLSWGYVLAASKESLYSLSKNRGARNSSRVIVGKTFPTNNTQGTDSRTDTDVAYVAVTDTFDGEANILSNLVNITDLFEDSYVT